MPYVKKPIHLIIELFLQIHSFIQTHKYPLKTTNSSLTRDLGLDITITTKTCEDNFEYL